MSPLILLYFKVGLFSRLQKRFRPSAQDTMTNTASWRGKIGKITIVSTHHQILSNCSHVDKTP